MIEKLKWDEMQPLEVAAVAIFFLTHSKFFSETGI